MKDHASKPSRSSLYQLQGLAEGNPRIRAELMACGDPASFRTCALSHAKAHGIALHPDDIHTLPDPVGASRFLPHGANSIEWPSLGWLPAYVADHGHDVIVGWHCFDTIALGAPFFSDAIHQARARPYNQLFPHRIRLRDMVEAAQPNIAPAGLIFHLSRCGSTLAHRMLDASGLVTSFSEVPALDEIVQLCHRPDIEPGMAITLLRTLVGALANSGQAKPIVLKLDCWHILDWRLLQSAFPQTPAFFIYRDPVEILVSQQRMRGMQTVPNPATAARCGIANYAAIDLDTYCAKFLAACCRSAVAAASKGWLRLCDYRQLPQYVVDNILPRCGVAVDAESMARMMRATMFNSKSPYERFKADCEDKQRAASADLRALAVNIIGPEYRLIETLQQQQ